MNAQDVRASATPAPAPSVPTGPAIRRVFVLLYVNCVLSAGLLGAVWLLRDGLDPVVWIRAAGVTVLALLCLRWAGRLRAGRRSAYLRMLWVSIAGPIGIAALVSLPGPYPVWVRVEQGVQGLVLLAVAWAVTRPEIRAHVPRKSR
ncbi:hypothetical protein [Sphaerisporangium fuscum]|uniref:hypothetical protein n=1 Tax=Sphaerisporangium fuscum TaxID=2835868 RepID=UPI001BDD949C|nr:hypothetical protein [Sphaerisporangium fuscum]